VSFLPDASDWAGGIIKCVSKVGPSLEQARDGNIPAALLR